MANNDPDKVCTRRAGKLYKARSRLYRSQILQVNMRLKALAESYNLRAPLLTQEFAQEKPAPAPSRNKPLANKPLPKAPPPQQLNPEVASAAFFS